MKYSSLLLFLKGENFMRDLEKVLTDIINTIPEEAEEDYEYFRKSYLIILN